MKNSKFSEAELLQANVELALLPFGELPTATEGAEVDDVIGAEVDGIGAVGAMGAVVGATGAVVGATGAVVGDTGAVVCDTGALVFVPMGAEVVDMGAGVVSKGAAVDDALAAPPTLRGLHPV